MIIRSWQDATGTRPASTAKTAAMIDVSVEEFRHSPMDVSLVQGLLKDGVPVTLRIGAPSPAARPVVGELLHVDASRLGKAAWRSEMAALVATSGQPVCVAVALGAPRPSLLERVGSTVSGLFESGPSFGGAWKGPR